MKTNNHKSTLSGCASADSPTNDRGFTLIELLVVLAIIGLLVGIVTLSVNNARVRGRDAKRVGDMRQMITALEQYHIQYGIYPTGTASVASAGNGALLSDPAAMDQALQPFVPNYAPFMPQSPEPADGDCLDTPGRGSNNYWYDVSDDGLLYTMTFCLGKDNGSWMAGIRIATQDGVQ